MMNTTTTTMSSENKETSNNNNNSGIAGRINYGQWDKVANDLIQQVEQQDEQDIQEQKQQLGLDGKYARSAAEAEEREKYSKVQQTKKTLETFKKREQQIVQTFSDLSGTTKRITQHDMDAGKRVISLRDSNNATIVLTQDLSHIESKMPVNVKAKSFPDDAENELNAEHQQQQEERTIHGLIKVFVDNLHDCVIYVKCKLIAKTLEIHNCHNVTVKIEGSEATVATVQIDLSNNVNIEFHDAPSGKQQQQPKLLYWGDDKEDRIFHAGVRDLHVKIFRDGYLEQEITADYIKDGAIPIGNATVEEFQFVTSVVDGNLITEKVVRSGHSTGKSVRAMTDRELQDEQQKREQAAKMAIAMAEDMVQIKDKDGNVLVKKKTPESMKGEKEVEDDVVEEVYTSEIQNVLAECEQLKVRGNEAFGAGEYGQAILHYSLCLDKSTELPESSSSAFPRDVVYSNRAAAFLKLGQHEKAEADAKEATTINPDNVKAHFRLGLALHAASRYQEALPILAQAHKLEPKNKQIKQALQFCEVRLTQVQRKRMEG